MPLLKEIKKFLGTRVLWFMALGVFSGTLLFAVELGFAYLIQAFLLVLGIAQAGSLEIPRWIPQNQLLPVLGLLMIAAVLRGILQWAQYVMQESAHEHFRFLQRSRLLNWVYARRTASTAEVTKLFGERTNQAGIAVMYLQSGLLYLSASVLLGGSLFWISPPLASVGVLSLLLLGPPLYLLNRKMSRAGRGLVEEWEKTNRRLIMGIRNLLLLNIYGTKREEKDLAKKSISSYLRHSLQHKWIAGFIFASPQMFGMVVVIVLVLFASSVSSNPPSPGILVSFFYLFIRFLQISSQVAFSGANFLFYRPQLFELARWWKKNFEGSQQTEHRPVVQDVFDSSPLGWRLKDVSFKYPESHHWILKNFNLEISPGNAVVILGPSGAGKSTLLDLILGQLSSQGGSVRFFTKEHSEQPLHSGVLTQMGYVGPESFLFEGTIRSNLIYGLKRTPSEREIKKAIDHSESHFVWGLPEGLEHFLTEQGTGLSAGQKQRISLARALLRNPKALILDEPTSNLDLETEKRLVKTLSQLKGEMTIVVVTHRRALLEIADKKVELPVRIKREVVWQNTQDSVF